MAFPANAEESNIDDVTQLERKENSATEAACSWQAKLRESTTKYVGYVESVEAAMTVIKQYELETTTKFSCFKSDKMFGAGGEII